MRTLTLALSTMMLLLVTTRTLAAGQVGASATNDDTNYQALLALCKEYTSLKAGPDSAGKQEKEQAIWKKAQDLGTISAFFAYLKTVQNPRHEKDARTTIGQLAAGLKPADTSDVSRINAYLDEYWTRVINLGYNFLPQVGWCLNDTEVEWRNAHVMGAKPPVVSDGSEMRFVKEKDKVFIYVNKQWRVLPPRK